MDNNATTPLDSRVQEKIPGWLKLWGNPSSIHQDGRGPKRLLRDSRRKLAEFLGCHPLELILTSGGSEANNLAIKGLLGEIQQKSPRRNKLIISSVEHPSVEVMAQFLETSGYIVERIPVSREGVLDVDFYKSVVDEQTALVSVMMANNEVGMIFPIQEMVQWAHEKGAYFHCDSVQALGKMNFNLKELDIDMASFSGHKIHALKGGGLLYVKKGTPLLPLIHGGAQERGRRAGTENLIALASMAEMLPHLDVPHFRNSIGELRDLMERELCEKLGGVSILAQNVERLPNTSAFTISGIDGETLLMNLDIRGFSVSTGAACSSGNPEPSPVLLAMGVTREEAQSSLRVSLGRTTSREDICSFIKNLIEVVLHLRQLSSESEMIEESL